MAELFDNSLVEALKDPRIQGALMNFGVSLMSPPQSGATPFSQFGAALGQAGEGIRSVDEAARKQQETDAREALGESRATLAEARARGVEGGLEVQRGRLGVAQDSLTLKQQQADFINDLKTQEFDLKKQLGLSKDETTRTAIQARIENMRQMREQAERRIGQRGEQLDINRAGVGLTADRDAANRQRASTQAMIALQGKYQADKKAAETFNADPLNRRQPRMEVPTWEQYLMKNQHLVPFVPQAPGAVPGAMPAPAGPSARPIADTGDDNTDLGSPMPTDKKELVNGRPYMTPRGVLRWNAAQDRFLPM